MNGSDLEEPVSKTDRAYDAVIKLVETRGPGIKLPTIEEMCVEFGVSRTPLENAIRLIESRGLIRRRRGSGIYATERVRQKTIGVVFGGNIFSPGFSPFWSLLLQAVQDQARGRELVPRAYMDISEANGVLGGHAQLTEDLEARRLDGVLLLAPQHDQDETGLLRQSGVPFVVFGGAHPDWRVTLDWDPFLRTAARELTAAGSRRIGLIGNLAHAVPLAQALREAGAGEPEIADWSYETWATIIPAAGSRENCAHRLTEQMIASVATTPLPDTLVSLEDTATRGALIALMDAGIKPGRDIRVITAANKGSPVLEAWAGELVQFALDPAEIMQAALGMLETLMNGGTPSENPVRVGLSGVGDG